MNTVGDVQPDPSVIGKIAKPPFVRLPDPFALFARRVDRFNLLATRRRQFAPAGIMTDLVAP